VASEKSDRIRMICEQLALKLEVTGMPQVICVQKSYQIPSGFRAQSISRYSSAPVFLPKQPDPFLVGLEDDRGIVGAAVIQDNDLVWRMDLAEYRRDGSLNCLPAVVHGNNDTNFHLVRTPLPFS
jgi:hypothetical protein